MGDKIINKEKMHVTRDMQNNYSDKRTNELSFEIGDRVFLRITPI